MTAYTYIELRPASHSADDVLKAAGWANRDEVQKMHQIIGAQFGALAKVRAIRDQHLDMNHNCDDAGVDCAACIADELTEALRLLDLASE